MKKLFLTLLAVFSIALVVAGCGGDSKPVANSGDKKVVLKVGATPVPHAEILNLIKPQLAKEGIDLQIIELACFQFTILFFQQILYFVQIIGFTIKRLEDILILDLVGLLQFSIHF